MKIIKLLLMLLVFILFIFLIFISYKVFTFNPNQYKSIIQQNFHQRYSLTFGINDKIDFTVFPNLSLVFNQPIIYYDTNQTKEFFKAEQIQISLNLFYFLLEEIKLNKIYILGADVKIENRLGANNEFTQVFNYMNETGNQLNDTWEIDKIEFSNSQILYNNPDKKINQHIKIKELIIQDYVREKFANLKVDFDLITNNSIHLLAQIKTKVKIDSQIINFEFKDFQIDANIKFKKYKKQITNGLLDLEVNFMNYNSKSDEIKINNISQSKLDVFLNPTYFTKLKYNRISTDLNIASLNIEHFEKINAIGVDLNLNYGQPKVISVKSDKLQLHNFILSLQDSYLTADFFKLNASEINISLNEFNIKNTDINGNIKLVDFLNWVNHLKKDGLVNTAYFNQDNFNKTYLDAKISSIADNSKFELALKMNNVNDIKIISSINSAQKVMSVYLNSKRLEIEQLFNINKFNENYQFEDLIKLIKSNDDFRTSLNFEIKKLKYNQKTYSNFNLLANTDKNILKLNNLYADIGKGNAKFSGSLFIPNLNQITYNGRFDFNQINLEYFLENKFSQHKNQIQGNTSGRLSYKSKGLKWLEVENNLEIIGGLKLSGLEFKPFNIQNKVCAKLNQLENKNDTKNSQSQSNITFYSNINMKNKKLDFNINDGLVGKLLLKIEGSIDTQKPFLIKAKGQISSKDQNCNIDNQYLVVPFICKADLTTNNYQDYCFIDVNNINKVDNSQ